MNQEDILKSWLDNAHAMESAIIDTLKQHINDADGHPEVQQQLRRHLFETESHAQMIEDRLDQLGVNVSNFKATVAGMVGKAQGIMTGMPRYKLVQNAIADFATEHYEIATYTAILNLARRLEDIETMQLCREIMTDEEAMADWLESHLSQVVQEQVQENVSAR